MRWEMGLKVTDALLSRVCAQDSRTPLVEAIIHDKARLVELLVKAGADIDAVDAVSQRVWLLNGYVGL